MKQRMINEMFKRITKGPARDDMIIHSKKHFMDLGGGKKRFNEIHVFHWHLKNRWSFKQTNYKYQILFCNFEEYYFSDKCYTRLKKEFDSWKEAFEWLAEYLLTNEF